MSFLRLRTILAFVFFIGSTLVWGQDPGEKQLSDSLIIQDLLDRSEKLIYSDPDSSYLLATKAIEMADELKYYAQSALGLSTHAAIFSLRGAFTEALHNDLMVLERSRQSGDSILIGRAFNNIGNDHLEVRNFDDAYKHFLIAYGIAEDVSNEKLAIIATFNLGQVLKELGQYEGALQKYEEALLRGEKINDEEGAIYSNSEIGHVYFLQGEFDKAEPYFRKGIDVSNKLDIPDVKAELMQRHAMNVLHTGNVEDARMYFNESLKIAIELKNSEMQASILNGLGTLSLYEKDYATAEQKINESLKLSATSNKNEIEAKSYNILYLIELQRNNFESALSFYKKYHEIQDEIVEKQKKVQISNRELEYDIERKDFEIATLKNQENLRLDQINKQKILRNVLVVLLAFSAILLYIVYRSGRRRRKINELLTIHKNEVEQQKNELAELNKVKDKFFSILAHDLRAPIRSLVGVLKLLESNNLTKEETEKMMGAIGRRAEETQLLLDNLLEWALIQMDKITVTKVKVNLPDLVDKNIKFLKETSDKPVQIKNEIQSEYAFADQNMVDLVIRNILSNAIKYSENNGEIVVKSKNDGKQVTIHIQDFGVGITPQIKDELFKNSRLITYNGTANEKGTGLGLKISKEFVERNGGTIWFESQTGQGSIFSFSLPVLPSGGLG